MSELLLTIETNSSRESTPDEIVQVWIDQQEVTIMGLSLSQLLRHMQEQGWSLGRAKVCPLKSGVRLSYEYSRDSA